MAIFLLSPYLVHRVILFSSVGCARNDSRKTYETCLLPTAEMYLHRCQKRKETKKWRVKKPKNVYLQGLKRKVTLFSYMNTTNVKRKVSKRKNQLQEQQLFSFISLYPTIACSFVISSLVVHCCASGNTYIIHYICTTIKVNARKNERDSDGCIRIMVIIFLILFLEACLFFFFLLLAVIFFV